MDDINFERYSKVKCSKIEGMLPKLMKMVEGGDEEYEINSMGKPSGTGKGDALRRSAGSGGRGAFIIKYEKD